MPTAIRRVYDNVRTGQLVFRDVGRLRQILSVLARHGFGAFVQQLNLQDRWLISKSLELRSTELERLPLERRLVHAMQELGPTFVKLGQMLSTRPDLLPAALVDELQSLQDAVPPMSLDQVRSAVQAELGDRVDELFDRFDEQPLASASIAQVHCARLKATGTEVVVKVQRPGIRPQIEADLEIMGFLARALEANFPEMQVFSPAAMVTEFERAILKELDFGYEIENLERFGRNFSGNPKVYFPVPQHECSTSRLLTMELIEGTKVTRLEPGQVDVDEVVRSGLDAVLQMIFVDGFFHGDLHPGNLLVRGDGVLCFLDCGLCGRLTSRQRDQLVGILIAMVRQDFEAVARLFWRLGVHPAQSAQQYDAFVADVVDCMEHQLAGKKLGGVDFGGFFQSLIQIAVRHQMRMPPDYTMTFKAIMTMEGIAKELAPEMDLIAAARPHVARLVAERYGPERMLERGQEAIRDLVENLGSLPETWRAVLEDLRAGRARINVELPQLAELRRAQARAQNRNAIALLTAASALCGTLALEHRSYTIWGFPAVSFLFYAIAGGLALWFAFGRSRRSGS